MGQGGRGSGVKGRGWWDQGGGSAWGSRDGVVGSQRVVESRAGEIKGVVGVKGRGDRGQEGGGVRVMGGGGGQGEGGGSQRVGWWGSGVVEV